jgi:hypothetical protein
MPDKKLFTHELEHEAYQTMQSAIMAETDLRNYYEQFVKPALIPDLLGKTVKVTPKQLGWVYSLAENIAATLDMDIPDIFVYQSYYYLVESKGLDDNWIEISAKTLADFNSEELLFLLAKEMCAIKLRHTYYETLVKYGLQAADSIPLLSSQEVQAIFKAKLYRYIRIAGFTSDNFAYLQCRNLKTCINAIIKTVLNDIYLAGQISVPEFLKQGAEINGLQEDAHNLSKMDELSPYSPFRIKNLIAYAASERGMQAISNESRRYLKC